jgi:hypothetical protein
MGRDAARTRGYKEKKIKCRGREGGSANAGSAGSRVVSAKKKCAWRIRQNRAEEKREGTGDPPGRKTPRCLETPVATRGRRGNRRRKRGTPCSLSSPPSEDAASRRSRMPPSRPRSLMPHGTRNQRHPEEASRRMKTGQHQGPHDMWFPAPPEFSGSDAEDPESFIKDYEATFPPSFNECQ